MTEPTTKRSKTVNLAVDLRIVVISLLIIMLGMLMSWRPWSAANSTDRSITVTGNATLKSAPDEYVFYPTYEFKNAPCYQDRNWGTEFPRWWAWIVSNTTT